MGTSSLPRNGIRTRSHILVPSQRVKGTLICGRCRMQRRRFIQLYLVGKMKATGKMVQLPVIVCTQCGKKANKK